MKELEEVTTERDDKRKEHDSLRKQRLDEFMAGFSIITTKLKEMYQVSIYVPWNFKKPWFAELVPHYLESIHFPRLSYNSEQLSLNTHEIASDLLNYWNLFCSH